MKHYALPASDSPVRLHALPETAGDEAADRCLEHRLISLGRTIDREVGRDLKAALGLSAAEWRVLSFVCATGAASAVDICIARETDPAEVSRAVAALLKRGLIRRETDDGHHCKKRIMPTDAGRSMGERAAAIRNGYFATLMQDIPPAAAHTFGCALEGIASRVSEWRGLPGGDAGREVGALPAASHPAASNIIANEEVRPPGGIGDRTLSAEQAACGRVAAWRPSPFCSVVPLT